MSWATDCFEIESEGVHIRQYRKEDYQAIAEALNEPQGFYAVHWGIDSPAKILEMLQKLNEAHAMNKCNPLVYLVNGEVAGITRFMNIEPSYRCLEIGGTWVAPKWRRSFVNTEVKFQLLDYAFSVLQAERVEFRVNVVNFPSQLAVLRIGAVFEGRMRNRHWHVHSAAADGHIYSVVRGDWPLTRERLQLMREGKQIPPAHLPFSFETPRLRARVYGLRDAEEFFNLVQKNKKSLIDSFPQSCALQSVEETRAWLAARVHQVYAGQSFFYGVWLGDRQVGQFQIKNIDWKVRSADLGYFIDEDFRRQGFASELLEHALGELQYLNFRRSYVRVLEENGASMRLVEKHGFTKEGVQRAAFVTGSGELKNVVFFSRV